MEYDNARDVAISMWMKEENNRRILRLRRAGNALAVTLPKKWLKELNWKETDYVILEKVLDKVIVSRARTEAL